MATILIIKGDKFQAARFAADRGVALAYIDDNGKETRGKTPLEKSDPKIQNWYRDSNGKRRGGLVHMYADK